MNFFQYMIVYLLCGVITVAGVFTGISFYRDVTAESGIYGEDFNISFAWSMEQFGFVSSSVPFSPEGNDFVFKQKLLKVRDFDGTLPGQELKLNGFVVFDSKFFSRLVSGTFYIEFYDTSGKLELSTSMRILIEFYSTETVLTLTVSDGPLAAQYIRTFFENNWIQLSIERMVQNES